MTRRHLLFLAASVAVLTAAAASPSSSLPPTGTAPYSQTDLRVGTGAEVLAGQTVTVIYTGWLYSDTAAENKGTVFNGPNQRAPNEDRHCSGVLFHGCSPSPNDTRSSRVSRGSAETPLWDELNARPCGVPRTARTLSPRFL